METRIGRSLLGTCVVIVMVSCCISGVTCDVPDDVVYTDLHKNVRIGDSVVLKCQFRGTPLSVFWKKGHDPKRAPNLVSWTQNDDVTGKCVGERPCRIMEMNEDRSLVIKEVSIAEQGRYICSVESFKGILLHNLTDISVFSPPKQPYPLINECLRSPDMKSNQTCIISTTEDPINISCTASGFFPDLDLFFLRGYQYITTIHSVETTSEDGKKYKSITSQASSSSEPYVCVASDIPGVGGRRVASVLVTTATASVDRSDGILAVKIVVPVVFIILLVAAILGAIIRWHIPQPDRDISHLTEIRNESDYNSAQLPEPQTPEIEDGDNSNLTEVFIECDGKYGSTHLPEQQTLKFEVRLNNIEGETQYFLATTSDYTPDSGE